MYIAWFKHSIISVGLSLPNVFITFGPSLVVASICFSKSNSNLFNVSSTICLVSSALHLPGIYTNLKLKASPFTPCRHKTQIKVPPVSDAGPFVNWKAETCTRSHKIFKSLNSFFFFLFIIIQYDCHDICFVLRHFITSLNHTLTNKITPCDWSYCKSILCRQTVKLFQTKTFL